MSFDLPETFNLYDAVYQVLATEYGRTYSVEQLDGQQFEEAMENILNQMSHDAFLLELDRVFHDYHREVFRTMDRFDDRINDLEKGLHHG